MNLSHRRLGVKPATAADMASITLTIGELVCRDSQLDIGDLACRRLLINVLAVTGARLHTLHGIKVMISPPSPVRLRR